MDEDEAATVVEQHVRAAHGLGADEPIPTGPFALAWERARERERLFADQVRERHAAVASTWEQVVHLAQRGSGDVAGREPAVVWRDPAPRTVSGVAAAAAAVRHGPGRRPAAEEPTRPSPALSSPYGPFSTHPTHPTHSTHTCDAGQKG